MEKEKLNKIVKQKILVSDLSNQELSEFCEIANLAYRNGNAIISDSDYDFIYLKELKKRIPNHPLLLNVEEGEVFGEKINLPETMLSTDKAYSWDEIKKWLMRLEKAAKEINLKISNILIKVTPKLDGFAGFDDGIRLYTRGDGRKGSDISRVFKRGLSVYNNSKRGQGAGEIVVKKSYFQKHLKDFFEHPRNFQASIIKEKHLATKVKKTIADNATFFVPFSQLPKKEVSIFELEKNFEHIINDILISVDFEVDGVILETINPELKNHMGSNRKFHRWQIALKENKDKAQVKVSAVTPQVGRTGKITPVAELKPVLLSGATIKRATYHNYAMVINNGLGENSIVELIRSGSVIPKINKVIKKSKVDIPTNCPSCGRILIFQSDFLICTNHDNCPEQIIHKLEYFFRTLNNNDGFGLATIRKLYNNKIHKISDIYKLKLKDFINFGFGDKTAQNLINQLIRSKSESIEDWRFLAAFGIERMGLGNSERLLQAYSLDMIFDLTIDKINSIEGFAEISSQSIINGLKNIKKEFNILFKLGFNIEITKKISNNHILAGKTIVFTGKMNKSRDEIIKYAKSLNIKVAKQVSTKTDLLIIGENVGQKKISAAKNKNVKIITIDAFFKI